ncbi:lytic transglycosylase domain-containing protein [Sulfitobacter pacificus]|uniref:lytic transglycosylase domain-containing protein n=1 Tax=Sulfitobacter pacificus TaxID=1499314 RepID=UPI003105882B
MRRSRSRSDILVTVLMPGATRRVAILLLSGFAAALPANRVALAETALPALTVARDTHAAAISEASVRFAIPEHWIRAVMRVESAGNPQAISRAGAMGLMQVMPGTWVELRQHHGLGQDPFDPRENIIAGTAYLRAMLDRYGTVGAMLAAYNAGPGRYDEFLSTERPLPAETRAYVATLAPLLDRDGALPHRSSATDWREAALFADRSAASELPSESEPATARSTLDDPAPTPTSELFVARQSEGSQP